MSEDFTNKASAEMARRIATATDPSELMHALRDQRDRELAAQPSPTPAPAPPAAAPKSDDEMLHQFFQMPDGSLREIAAQSFSGLDTMRKTLEYYGGKLVGGVK